MIYLFSKGIQTRSFNKFNSIGYGLFCLVLIVSSCAAPKNINYFPTIKDEVIENKQPVPEPQIQLNDLMSITVSSSNPEASAIFNAPNESTNTTSSAAASANTLTIGYLVNQNGDIQFPVLGTSSCGWASPNFNFPR